MTDIVMSAADRANPFKRWIPIRDVTQNGLAAEDRLRRKGGTYMPPSALCKYHQMRLVPGTPVHDKYVGTIQGYTWEVGYRLHPCANLLEDIDFKTNIRPHSLALWQLSVVERSRMTAKAKAMLESPAIRKLADERGEALRSRFEILYSTMAENASRYADYGIDTFRSWAKDHADSSTGFVIEGGKSKWEGIIEDEALLTKVHSEIAEYVRNFWGKLPEYLGLILNPDYAWDPHMLFPALRNRPDTEFQQWDFHEARYKPIDAIPRTSGQIRGTMGRSRAAAGMVGPSWILFPFAHDDALHQFEATAIKKAVHGLANISRLDGPILSGVANYAEAMSNPMDLYMDASNCEKMTGILGKSIGRTCLKMGGGQYSAMECVVMCSGHSLTTPDNIIFNAECADYFAELLGRPVEIFLHGDNHAYRGATPEDYDQLIAQNEGLDELLTKEDVWLGHGKGRVVGLKLTKDSKDNSMRWEASRTQSKPGTGYNKRPSIDELTGALLVRDVLHRHFNAPSYANVLKYIAEKVNMTEQERRVPGYYHIQDNMEKFQDLNLVQDCRQIVVDNYGTLVDST